MDYRLFHDLNGLAAKDDLFDAAIRFYASNGALIFPAVLILLWLFPGRQALRARTAAVAAAAAAVVAFGINQSLNHVANRARPYAVHQVHLLLARSHDASFPSDHTAVAFAVAGGLWSVRPRLGSTLAVLGALLW
jgi:undecaprenyl-diphosphatase